MRIYIVRHGETRLNREARLQGWVDEPLLEEGRQLATVTGQGLGDIAFDLCFSSPLKRALETAELILKENKTASSLEIRRDDRLREIRWGVWDCKICVGENIEVPAEEYLKVKTDPLHFSPPEGAESFHDVIRRCRAFYDEITADASMQDKTILISTHGVAMRSLLNHIYEDSADFWHGRSPYNLAVNIVDYKDGVSTLVGDDVIYYDKSLCFDPYGYDS